MKYLPPRTDVIFDPSRFLAFKVYEYLGRSFKVKVGGLTISLVILNC